uniref:Uncharacterized protein n=1 Tax=Fagus sylvatica TaxID=28930 RepID=A0A2N9G5Q8_FAGSY
MATTKSVDASLWWDPFSLLLTDLESAPLSSDLPPNLAKKVEGKPRLCLDEVQSYIIVERSLKDNNLGADSIVQEYLHVIMLQYYMERQCLLKCTRRILMHALYVGTDSKEGQIIREEALKLISDGLERKSISVLEDLLSSSHPEQMDVDLFTLSA